jgi:hypothetical protein
MKYEAIVHEGIKFVPILDLDGETVLCACATCGVMCMLVTGKASGEVMLKQHGKWHKENIPHPPGF